MPKQHKGAIHPLIQRYGWPDTNDSAAITAFLLRVFRHGLTVGMWASHSANEALICQRFKDGTLPDTMTGLNQLEDSLK